MTEHGANDDRLIDGDAIDPAELTLEADPVWLDEIRSHAGETGADPELTIDASPELVDVIRAEIARRDATSGERQAPPEHPAASAPPSPTSAAASSPSAPPVPPTMPGSPPSLPSADVAPGTPTRWQPQQRLASRAPVTATTPIVRTDHRHRTKDSTKIVLAAIAATAVVAVAWLLVGGETADAPPVIDPSSTVDVSQPAPASSSPASTPP
jgi:hypothetical protein